MKIKKALKLFLSLLIFSTLSLPNSCGERNETVSCFPNSVISVQLNLSLNSYYNLNNVGGWVYVDEVGAGTNGLIVYRATSGFMIYDRNAPHICPDTNTILRVDNGGTFVICPKDNAKWALFDGQPQPGETVPKTGLKTYRSYSYDSSRNILSIYN